MSRHLIGLFFLAAAILVAILGIAPKAHVTMNASSTEILAIDILGLTKNAKDDLPEQNYAAH